MASGDGALDFVDEAGDSIDGVVFGSGPKLCHGEEIELFDVGVDLLGNDLFKKFAGAFKEGNWVVGLRYGIVWLLGLVDHNDHRSFPRVVSCV